MRKVYLILILLILSVSAFAVELKVLKSIPSPKDFYVGDLVTLLVYVETPFESELKQPETISGGEWIDIKSIDIVKSGPEESIIRITFTSFAPGLRVVPDISFGEHTLHDLKVQTLSILDDRFTELQPISPQMVPPGTNLLLTFVLLGVILGPYLLYIILKTFFYSVKLAINRYRREKPLRDYLKILKGLKSTLSDCSVRDFYVEITEHLRIYLSIRFNREFSSATTMEMLPLLAKIMDKDSYNELLSICRFADLVKFSHVNASSMHREKDLKTIVEIVYQLEGKDKENARI